MLISIKNEDIVAILNSKDKAYDAIKRNIRKQFKGTEGSWHKVNKNWYCKDECYSESFAKEMAEVYRKKNKYKVGVYKTCVFLKEIN